MTRRLHVEQWFFPFIDILYVAAVKNISSVTGECDDKDFEIYIMVASFLLIMFSSRLIFDIFSHSYGTRTSFNPLFVFTYTLGVFIMAFFIAVIPVSATIDDDTPCQQQLGFGESDKLFLFGNCHQGMVYSFGFAVGFLLTRVVVICGYVIQYRSKETAIAPAVDIINEALRSKEPPNDMFLSAVKEFHVYRGFKDVKDKLVFYRGVALGYQLGVNHETVDKSYLRLLDNFAFEHAYEIAVFSLSSTVVVFGMGFYRDFAQPYWMLIASLIEAFGISSKRDVFKLGQRLYLMLSVKPAMTSTETSELAKRLKAEGEFITATTELYKRTAHFYQGRLGLFFMLILGEAILGLAVIDLRTGKLWAVVDGLLDLFFSFIIIIGIGYTYNVSTDANKDEHAMVTISYGRRNFYIWFHVVAGFAMLMVSNSMEHLVKETQTVEDAACHYIDTSTQVTAIKLGLGLAVTWLCLHLLRYLHRKSTIICDVQFWITCVVALAHFIVCFEPLTPPDDCVLGYHCGIIAVGVSALVVSDKCRKKDGASFNRRATEIMMTAFEPFRNSLEMEDHRLSLTPEEQLIQAEEVFGIGRQESSETLVTNWLQKNVDLEKDMLTSLADEIQRNSDIRRGQQNLVSRNPTTARGSLGSNGRSESLDGYAERNSDLLNRGSFPFGLSIHSLSSDSVDASDASASVSDKSYEEMA